MKKLLVVLISILALAVASTARAGKSGTISFNQAYVAGTSPVSIDACGFNQKYHYYVLVARNTDPTASVQLESAANWWSSSECLIDVEFYLPVGTWNLDVENSWGGGNSSVVSNVLTVTVQ